MRENTINTVEVTPEMLRMSLHSTAQTFLGAISRLTFFSIYRSMLLYLFRVNLVISVEGGDNL